MRSQAFETCRQGPPWPGRNGRARDAWRWSASTAEDLAAGTAPGSNGHEMCRSYASSFTNGTSITFGTMNELPQADIDPNFTRY